MKKIIHIDDDASDAEFLQRALRKNRINYPVDWYSDPIAALDYLFSEETPLDHLPDLTFLDINLPLMDGFEVLTQIRGSLKTADLKIVMLSTSDEEKVIKKSYECGANHYIQKSTDTDKFNNAILNAVKKFIE